jgi:type I restriction enzyme M protein
MDKKSLTEADICAKFITPALVGADGGKWNLMTQIREQVYFTRGRVTECNLHTIVRLPNGVFNPYTGIRTNLLFFTKGTPTREIWYYEHPYPPGAKSYNKGKPIQIAEFEPEKAWWGIEKDGFKTRVENERAWRVPIDRIRAGNFNLDLKNPHRPDTGSADVEQLLAEYEQLLAQIAETRVTLKQELHRALCQTT